MTAIIMLPNPLPTAQAGPGGSGESSGGESTTNFASVLESAASGAPLSVGEGWASVVNGGSGPSATSTDASAVAGGASADAPAVAGEPLAGAEASIDGSGAAGAEGGHAADATQVLLRCAGRHPAVATSAAPADGAAAAAGGLAGRAVLAEEAGGDGKTREKPTDESTSDGAEVCSSALDGPVILTTGGLAGSAAASAEVLVPDSGTPSDAATEPGRAVRPAPVRAGQAGSGALPAEAAGSGAFPAEAADPGALPAKSVDSGASASSSAVSRVPDAGVASSATDQVRVDQVRVDAAPVQGLTPTRTVAAPPADVAPALAPQIVDQLSARLPSLRAAGLGGHVLSLNVEPDSFGPVRVVAHIRSDGVHIELLSSSAAGQEALRTALPDLRRDLVGTGLAADLRLGGSGRNDLANNGGQASGGEGGNAGRAMPDHGSSAGARETRAAPDVDHAPAPEQRTAPTSSVLDLFI